MVEKCMIKNTILIKLDKDFVSKYEESEKELAKHKDKINKIIIYSNGAMDFEGDNFDVIYRDFDDDGLVDSHLILNKKSGKT
jgi:CRISPR/Cas system-associated protein Cas5 (RAMP superfamily)